MSNILYLLLIAFGALLILSIFQLTIYLQQKDKAYLHYSLYLFVMAVFNVVRMLDARLTSFYPLPIHTVQTLDAILSNLGFLMYVNFLGVVLNISRSDKFFFKSWRFIQFFVLVALSIYTVLKFSNNYDHAAEIIMACCSFFCMGYGLLLIIRLFRFIQETFYLLIITGTTIVVVSIIAGLVVCYFIYHDRLSFSGLALMEIGMFLETIFLSAAMGYRLKLAYREKEIYHQNLLQETKRNEQLAKQTAQLLRKELDLRKWQIEVSRDLHDDLGASLSAIHVYSTVASKVMDTDRVKAKDVLHHINTNARQIMENMSDIVWAISTTENHSITLENKLKNYGYELLNPLGIYCNYQIEKEVEKKLLHSQTRKNVLMVAKEAMNNIAKYSQATESKVKVAIEQNNLAMEISDNGKGFEIETRRLGNGLSNMKQRVEAMNGFFSCFSEKGKGTVIRCTIPITSISDIH